MSSFVKVLLSCLIVTFSQKSYRMTISQNSNTGQKLLLTTVNPYAILINASGEVSERFMELVLKTSDSKEPWVRIPPSPPLYAKLMYR